LIDPSQVKTKKQNKSNIFESSPIYKILCEYVKLPNVKALGKS
jgi:hypothetical protein